MNKIGFILFIIIVYFSCNQTEYKKRNSELNNIEDSSALKIVNKSRNPGNIKKQNNVRYHNLKFPANYVIEEIGTAGDIILYYFYPDSKLLLRDLYSDDDFSVGSWFFVNDTIRIFIEKHFGYRGIGKEDIPEGFETVEHSSSYGYNEYIKFYEIVHYQFEISLKDTALSIYKIDTTLFAQDFVINENKYMIDGDFSIASMKALAAEDLKKYTSKELKLMRNEIYARYGYKFKSKELVDYFNSKNWFKPKNDHIDIYLTDLEKKNIDLIKKIELGQ